MKRKLCRMSRGRNASARSRWRSSGQTYRAATIPHAIRLNAMLTKNQIICCGMIRISFLEFLFGPFTNKEYDHTLYGQNNLLWSEELYEKAPRFRQQLLAL